MDALVTMPGATPLSAPGDGERGRVGVIVVHGFTGNPLSTRPLGQRFAAEGWAVEVPCLPGHGTNFRDLARTRYRDWYGGVDHLVDHLASGCDQIVLVGHSMGGTICLDIASRRPDDITAVATINAPVLTPHQPLAKIAPIIQFLVPYQPRDLAGMPSDDIARPDVEEGAYGVIPSKAAYSLIREYPRIRSQLHALKQPLLVAWSPQDHSVAPESSQALPELVSSTDVEEVVLERLEDRRAPVVTAARREAEVVTAVDEVRGQHLVGLVGPGKHVGVVPHGVVESECKAFVDLHLDAELVLKEGVVGAALDEELVVDEGRGRELVLEVDGAADDRVLLLRAGDADLRLPSADAELPFELRGIGRDEMVAVADRGGRIGVHRGLAVRPP